MLNKNIHNCRWVTALFDGLEEVRALSRTGKNEKVIKVHIARLLEVKRTYWKQRLTIKFVKWL
jgi:hypothetical protein